MKLTMRVAIKVAASNSFHPREVRSKLYGHGIDPALVPTMASRSSAMGESLGIQSNLKCSKLPKQGQ
ncbi:hypothetical protein ACVWYH_000085 [Bradyrhizobium sp. GM24.11]